MEAKMMIAGSFDEFVEKITQAERKALNTPFGQEITERLLKMKLEENPDMTVEEWRDTKSQFLTFLFAMFVKETPQAMAELAQHTWDELQAKKYNATGRHCCRPERMVNDYENRYCYLQQVQWFWQIHL